jgi:uncharacterized membrane protein
MLEIGKMVGYLCNRNITNGFFLYLIDLIFLLMSFLFLVSHMLLFSNFGLLLGCFVSPVGWN